MDNGKIVWGPHSEHGFVLGTITDIGHDTITVQPKAPGVKVRITFLNMYNVCLNLF